MRLDIKNYKSLIFDCDGVILNSNKIKTNAFYKAVKHLGVDKADQLVNYHLTRGGVSRYEKFKYFISNILSLDFDEELFDDLLERYASSLQKDLINCEISNGLEGLRFQTRFSKWFIVSGGDQIELRKLFKQRNLLKFFDGGVFGSPETKTHIISREIKNLNLAKPALFIGDSKYDYISATKTNLDFVFVSDWTEVKDPIGWCKENRIKAISKISDLIS